MWVKCIYSVFRVSEESLIQSVLGHWHRLLKLVSYRELNRKCSGCSVHQILCKSEEVYPVRARLSSVVDRLVGVHIALLLQDVQPLLHRVFVLDQRALILLKRNSVSIIAQYDNSIPVSTCDPVWNCSACRMTCAAWYLCTHSPGLLNSSSRAALWHCSSA